MELVKVEPETKENFSLVSNEMLETVTSMTVSSPSEIAAAIETRKACKALAKQADEFFRPGLRKLEDAKKAIRASLRTITDPLDTAVRILDAKVIAANEAIEKARLEEEAAALASSEVDDDFGIVAAPKAEEKAIPSGTSVRRYYRAEVTNLEAFVRWCVKTENFHLLEPSKALSALARSTKGSIKIDGVKISEEKGLAG